MYLLINREDVKKTAELARLRLTDDEIDDYQNTLSEILEAANRLQDVDTAAVDPAAHAVESVNVYRDDVPKPGLDRDDVLRNGPHVVDGFFRVPRIMEE